MNIKILSLFIVFFVAILAMGSVNAVDLTHHNFDNHFSMKIPSGTTFELQEGSNQDVVDGMVFLTYVSEDNLLVMYADTPMISEASADYWFQSIFQSMDPDATKCYESQEDNLKILEPISNDGTQLPLVGINEGNKTVMLIGEDVDLLKEMGHTLKFK